MKKKLLTTIITLFFLLTLFSCSETKIKKDSISVYLWSNILMNNGYAKYIQDQLPDVDVEFVVSNNDLDFYQFLKDNDSLPDIITCRRFSLHDAVGLKDQLMDLSSTEEAGAVYDTYLMDFKNDDNTVNWLPLCGEVDGFVINKYLFDKYNIPVPTDYESFAYACSKFDEVGIRGFAADFVYDYTCMEILQGLSIPEITSSVGRIWRSAYENVNNTNVGLDDVVWPKAFEVMEKFIIDAKVIPTDINSIYSKNYSEFEKGKIAMFRSGGSTVINLKGKDKMDPLFLPYFGQQGEEWLLTYPAFQVALNKDLEKDTNRKNNALKVLKVMMSNDAQKIVASGNNIISYSKNVKLELDPALSNIKTLIDQNHLFIRIASNDFFSVSKTIVSKMITKEYDAKTAYTEFDKLLKNPLKTDNSIILSLKQSYSNKFNENGNESYSAMAHSLRQMYKTDILLCPATSFTGTVIKADYNEKMVGYMIMNNALDAYKATIKGERLKRFIKGYVEGNNAGFTPFNDGSLPIVSGITIIVEKKEGKYIVKDILKDGQTLGDDEEFSVTCLSVAQFMGSILADQTLGFKKESLRVKNAWVQYIKNGGTLLEPEKYIILQ